MTTLKIFTYAIVILISFVAKQENKVEPENAIDVMKRTSEKLNSLSEISYSYFRDVNYFSENYRSEAAGMTFLNFDKSDGSSEFKFQLENDNSKIIYNGNEFFSLDKQDKTISIESKPNSKNFENLSLFLNSIVTLKNSFIKIISDEEIQKSLSDTIVNKKSYYLVSLVLENKALSGFGNFSPITLKRSFFYKIVIDKTSYLPFQVIQTNNIEPKDYVLTSFTNIKTKDSAPPELSWYYSTYDDYKEKNSIRLAVVEENSLAPDFKLPLFDSDSTISLNGIQSKFILLEFWMKNCGYCIQAVPKLNNISSKFDKEYLEVVGINGSDDRQNINLFYEKTKPLFKTLFDEGGKVTKDFGVDAFPQIVLLDDNRKVIYSGNFDLDEIEKLLKVK